jgi:hypothetical protein
VHDANATVNTKCHGNLLIKHIKIKAVLLIAELCYANYVFILPNWEAQDVPSKQTSRNIFTFSVVITSYLQYILLANKIDIFKQYEYKHVKYCQNCMSYTHTNVCNSTTVP